MLNRFRGVIDTSSYVFWELHFWTKNCSRIRFLCLNPLRSVVDTSKYVFWELHFWTKNCSRNRFLSLNHFRSVVDTSKYVFWDLHFWTQNCSENRCPPLRLRHLLWRVTSSLVLGQMRHIQSGICTDAVH